MVVPATLPTAAHPDNNVYMNLKSSHPSGASKSKMGPLLGLLPIIFFRVASAQSNNKYDVFYDRPKYNCTIPRVVQGEWYSREKNLDTVTHIDASRMSRSGNENEMAEGLPQEYLKPTIHFRNSDTLMHREQDRFLEHLPLPLHRKHLRQRDVLPLRQDLRQNGQHH